MSPFSEEVALGTKEPLITKRPSHWLAIKCQYAVVNLVSRDYKSFNSERLDKAHPSNLLYLVIDLV